MFKTSRIYLKLFKSRILRLGTASFCRNCGCDVNDFTAPDEIWEKVETYTKKGVLCYNCFCNACYKIDLPPVWFLRGCWAICKHCGEKFIAENENIKVCHWYECSLAEEKEIAEVNNGASLSPT